jgi:hypothetical protein
VLEESDKARETYINKVKLILEARGAVLAISYLLDHPISGSPLASPDDIAQKRFLTEWRWNGLGDIASMPFNPKGSR